VLSFTVIYFLTSNLQLIGYLIIGSAISIYAINKIISNKFGGFNGDTLGFGIEVLKLSMFYLCLALVAD